MEVARWRYPLTAAAPAARALAGGGKPQWAALACARKRQRLGVGRTEGLVDDVPDPRQARDFAVHSKQRFRRDCRRDQKWRRIGEEQNIGKPSDTQDETQE